MKIFIDECLPAGLKGSLGALGYECETVVYVWPGIPMSM
jgi:hypothetical protein